MVSPLLVVSDEKTGVELLVFDLLRRRYRLFKSMELLGVLSTYLVYKAACEAEGVPVALDKYYEKGLREIAEAGLDVDSVALSVNPARWQSRVIGALSRPKVGRPKHEHPTIGALQRRDQRAKQKARQSE